MRFARDSWLELSECDAYCVDGVWESVDPTALPAMRRAALAAGGTPQTTFLVRKRDLDALPQWPLVEEDL